ncbi:MAG TPA: hypothetical protein VFO05_07455 [Candidatus Limnocylindrales bacterium]|nr:hypothetical protein [Candidatus Limnocylindrales bacterium]
MLSTTTRVVLGVLGTLIALGGLAAVGLGGSAAAGGLWAVILGVVLVLAVVLERHRYRSEEADKAFDPVGPGGGEPSGTVEPRFRPTDETFVDPTTGHRMRVHADPRTGERRYVAER